MTLAFVLLAIKPLNAGISFSSDDAKIKLATSGTKLNVATAMTIANGTFQRVTGTSMTGVDVAFSNAVSAPEGTVSPVQFAPVLKSPSGGLFVPAPHTRSAMIYASITTGCPAPPMHEYTGTTQVHYPGLSPEAS